MKRKMMVFVLAACLSYAPFSPRNAFTAGIPVIDASNLAQAVQQVIHMAEQIEQLKNQLRVAEKQLERMSGSRGMGGLLHSTYDLAVTVNQEEILETVGLRSAEDNGLIGTTAELYDEANRNVALHLGQSQKSLAQSQARYSELSKLVAKVNDSPDQKDILDLQARIQAEQTLLQNETIKLSMLQAEAQAREAAYQQKMRQRLLESGGYKPIAW